MNNAEKIGIWYDDEGDILTVTWEHKFGYYIDSDDSRVMVRVDSEGNGIGVLVHGFSTLKDKSLEVGHGMDRWSQLGKKRGSRPRCVLLTDGNRGEVAKRLTRLVNVPGVAVSPNDNWMPYGKPVKTEDGSWDPAPTTEAQLGNRKHAKLFVAPDIHRELVNWWFAIHKGRGPNWDIASTCKIKGKPGLLLVEAKAHKNELDWEGKKLKGTGSPNSRMNHERIGQAISEASAGLHRATQGTWNLSLDSHYQLVNRFAWSWKLASLGIPVVLVYLGFLDAQDMADRKGGGFFGSDADWEQAVIEYGEGVVDNDCWAQPLDVNGTTFLPLIRTYQQPFKP